MVRHSQLSRFLGFSFHSINLGPNCRNLDKDPMEKKGDSHFHHKKGFTAKGRRPYKKEDEESKEGDRKRKRITHFLALPVDNDTMLSSLEQVQNEIYDYYSDRLYDRWFMPPSRFHFSLLMMYLESQEEIDNAKEVLQSLETEIKELIASHKDFKLKIKGVGHFGFGRSGQTKVLYADLEKNSSFNILEEITDKIIKKFIEKGVADEKDFDSVKYDYKSKMYKLTYHLTLINTKYEKVDGKIIGFDGKEILEFYNNYDFGDFVPDKITIYQMKVDKGKYVTEKNIYI